LPSERPIAATNSLMKKMSRWEVQIRSALSYN